MGKRKTRPLPGDRKFHAPKAKRVLQEEPGAMPVPSQSSDLEDPARMDTQESKNSDGNKADPKGIPVGEQGAGSPQEGRDKEIRGGRALESPKRGISNEMEENHLELPQLGILEVDGMGEDELESPKPGILDGAGENCPDSPKPALLEVDGAGEEPPESVKHVILDGMGQSHLESSQLGILRGNGAAEEQLESPQLRTPEADGAGEEQLESLKQGISDGTGEDQLESPKPGISEVDGAAEEQQLETPTHGILDGTGEEHPEVVKPGISEADGAGEEQLESLKQGISDGTGEDQLESPKPGISEVEEDQLESPKPGISEVERDQLESPKPGISEVERDQLESPNPGISEVDGAAEEQLETPAHRILDGTGEEHPEAVKPGIPEADEAREEQLESLKQGIWDGAGENQLESPKQGNSGAHGSSPEDTMTDTAPAESLEVPDAEGEEEEGALEEGCGPGIVLRMDTGSPDRPSDPQGGGGDAESRNSQGRNASVATPGVDPAATSTKPQDQREGTSPELPTDKPFPDAAGQQPWDTTGQIHTGSTGNSPAQPRESSARATEPADASDVICGLIQELSDLNRLAMGARRGLELLRRPKPRRGRRPVPSGSRWKEG